MAHCEFNVSSRMGAMNVELEDVNCVVLYRCVCLLGSGIYLLRLKMTCETLINQLHGWLFNGKRASIFQKYF